MANSSNNPNIARQAYDTSQFAVNRANNAATGRLPNTYTPYDSNGNPYSYFNSSRQAGKTPSPDAPRVEDVSVSDNPSYCANGKYGYGEYTYKNVVCSIYVPGPNSSIYDDGWKTIDKNKVLAGIKIDWAKVLSGSLESTNIDPINAGYYQVSSGIVTNKTGLASSAAIQVVTDILKETEILNASLYIQEKEGEYRAVITASSSVAQQKYDLFANGKPIFLGLSNQGLASMSAKRLYEELSGKDVAWYLRGDVVVTIDPGHRGNGEVAYLWYDGDKLMGTPIIYAGDKIEVGVLEGLLGLTFKDCVEVPINTSPFEMSEYSEALIKGFNEKGE